MNDPQTELAIQRKPQTMSIAAGERGLTFNTLEAMYRFSSMVVASGMCPQGETPESALVKLQMGAEVGLTPMQAIQSIYVVNRRPTMWGDNMLALCMACPLLPSSIFDHTVFKEWIEGVGDNRVAYCTVARKGGKPVTRSFSVADAKVAGLWGKPGPWTTNPPRMLQSRARTFALRDTFPDILRGIMSREEVEDYEPIADSRPAVQSNASRLSAALDRPAFDASKAAGGPSTGSDPMIVDAARKIRGRGRSKVVDAEVVSMKNVDALAGVPPEQAADEQPPPPSPRSDDIVGTLSFESAPAADRTTHDAMLSIVGASNRYMALVQMAALAMPGDRAEAWADSMLESKGMNASSLRDDRLWGVVVAEVTAPGWRPS